MKILSAALLVVVLFFAWLCHVMSADDAARVKVQQDWLAFAMQHHCRIARDPTFGNPNTTWQCDGFQVVRF